ncbi:hypothetical protein RUM43_005230 [Polyplax serrata]|uniref:DUF3730 domain-containing protein n=1 Tax=Polyplax serrata TaxID=468196 RepID=A0AAN8XN86_POLSC
MDNMNENVGLISQEISKLIEVIETQVTLKGKITKECRELITLKEKCCSQSVMMAATACQGIAMLAERKTVVRSQIISTLISLLPSVVHCNILISTIGSVLLSDLKEPALKNDASSFECFDTADSTKDQYHPLVTVLKSVGKKCWFEIYSCIHDIIKCHEALKIDCKIAFLRPIFNHIFWSSEWRGSPLQTKLFSDLISKINNKAYLKLALETLNWQCVDIHYCMLLLDIITQLLSYKNYESDHIVQALTPALAITIRWITQNGYNPTPWINVMHSSISCGDSSHGVVLYLLTDAVVDAPPQYSSAIIDLCRSIIFGGSCNKYVAYRFVAVSLQWLISPSLLDYPIYRTVQDILLHINELESDWNDKTSSLLNNEYFKQFGRSFFDVKFSVDLVKMTNSWCIGRETLVSWLQNLKKSNHQGTNLNLHLLISGILLCEANKSIIEHCLGILLKLLEQNKDISFPFLRLLFYKLAQETDPAKQKVYLLNLPKLAVKKENIPLIVGIIESLKNGKSNIMKPLIIQLYLTMWKIDGRTYLYLHKLLHDKLDDANDLELNLSRALALREICRLAPHLHGKDVISVVSRVLNECADRSMNGLPSAITIEAIIELCKAHVIDISGR